MNVFFLGYLLKCMLNTDYFELQFQIIFFLPSLAWQVMDIEVIAFFFWQVMQKLSFDKVKFDTL